MITQIADGRPFGRVSKALQDIIKKYFEMVAWFPLFAGAASFAIPALVAILVLFMSRLITPHVLWYIATIFAIGAVLGLVSRYVVKRHVVTRWDYPSRTLFSETFLIRGRFTSAGMHYDVGDAFWGKAGEGIYPVKIPWIEDRQFSFTGQLFGFTTCFTVEVNDVLEKGWLRGFSAKELFNIALSNPNDATSTYPVLDIEKIIETNLNRQLSRHMPPAGLRTQIEMYQMLVAAILAIEDLWLGPFSNIAKVTVEPTISQVIGNRYQSPT